MEEDFLVFGTGLGMIGLPFVTIFLILRAIKWNERTSLFFDSWAVYLGWVFSGLATIFIFGILDNLLPFRLNINSNQPLILIFILQIYTVSAILYWRSLPKKEFSLASPSKTDIQIFDLHKILKAAFLVCIVTFLLMWGFIAALTKLNNQPNPPDNNGISFSS